MQTHHLADKGTANKGEAQLHFFNKKQARPLVRWGAGLSILSLIFMFQNCSSGKFASLSGGSSTTASSSSGSDSNQGAGSGSGNVSGGSGGGAPDPVDLTGLVQAKQVYAGVGVSCIIDLTDHAQCWGGASLGQSKVTASLTPIEPQGVGPVISIVSSTSGVCALTKAHQVMCWSDYNPSSLPQVLPGLTNVDFLAGGWGHFCALTADQKIMCWGLNNFGQIGLAPNTPISGDFLGAIVNEVHVTGVVKNLELGMYSSCAVTTDNRVFCWGSNMGGLLGRELQVPNYSAGPVEILGLGNVRLLRIGLYSACVINSDTKVFCWGANSSGQLGNNSTVDSMLPVEVVGAKGAVDIKVSSLGACAYMPDGQYQCWGPMANSLVPAVYSPLSRFKDISMGYMYGCGLTAQQTVRCWGANQFLQLGLNNNLTASASAVELQPNYHSLMQNSFNQIQKNTIRVGSTGYFRCALTTDQHVQCWGSNEGGLLGNNTNVNSLVPVDVYGLGAVKALSVGGSHSCAITQNDQVKCWGVNYAGALGNNTKVNSIVPVDVAGLGAVKSVQAGLYGFTCAITVNDLMKCWGYNADGVLGNNTSTDSLVPVDVVGLGPVKSMALGANFSCAITMLDKVKCWGSPSILGKSSFSGADMAYAKGYLPYEVSSVGVVKSIAAGDRSVCVITSMNQVKCWGDSSNFRLGVNGSKLSSIDPVTVSGVDGAVAIASRFGSTCATLASGQVKCWGDNKFGKLGVANLNNYIEPTLVVGKTGSASDIIFDLDATYFVDATSGQVFGSGILVPSSTLPTADLKY